MKGDYKNQKEKPYKLMNQDDILLFLTLLLVLIKLKKKLQFSFIPNQAIKPSQSPEHDVKNSGICMQKYIFTNTETLCL